MTSQKHLVRTTVGMPVSNMLDNSLCSGINCWGGWSCFSCIRSHTAALHHHYIMLVVSTQYLQPRLNGRIYTLINFYSCSRSSKKAHHMPLPSVTPPKSMESDPGIELAKLEEAKSDEARETETSSVEKEESQ